jgi:hypothetical protein
MDRERPLAVEEATLMSHHLHRRTHYRKTWLSAPIAVMFLVAIVAPAAFARELVDPSTLIPPVPAAFNPVCYQVGEGTICDIAFSDPPLVNEPSGIICGTTELLISQTRDVVAKRFYNVDGLLTVRRFQEDFAGSLMNPLTGATVQIPGRDTVTDDLATPGDLNSGTETRTGLEWRAYLPGGGTIITDVGHIVVDAATGDIVDETGHHPFDRYFAFGDTAALEPICSALGLG